MIYAFGSVVYPAVATIKSSKCPPDEQGRVLGALNGIQMMAWGLGPMVFNNIFAWLIDEPAQARFKHKFGFQFPLTAVWWLGIVFSVITLALAFSIPDPRDVYIDYDDDQSGVPKTVQGTLHSINDTDERHLSPREFTARLAQERQDGVIRGDRRAQLRRSLLEAPPSVDYRADYRG